MNTPKLPPLPERLRDAARKLRTSSIPLADFIPLLQQAADAIAAIQAQAVPDGWQLVPKEPTKEMWDAVNRLDDQCAAGNYDGKGCSIEQAWDCLLASAPPAPQAAHSCKLTECQGRPRCGTCKVTGMNAPQAKPQPLSDEQKLEMWTQATIEQCSHSACYMRGIEDAEAVHGIKE